MTMNKEIIINDLEIVKTVFYYFSMWYLISLIFIQILWRNLNIMCSLMKDVPLSTKQYFISIFSILRISVTSELYSFLLRKPWNLQWINQSQKYVHSTSRANTDTIWVYDRHMLTVYYSPYVHMDLSP